MLGISELGGKVYSEKLNVPETATVVVLGLHDALSDRHLSSHDRMERIHLARLSKNTTIKLK